MIATTFINNYHKRQTMKTLNSKPSDHTFKFLTVILLIAFVALIVFSVQWYEAWAQLQEVQIRLSVE